MMISNNVNVTDSNDRVIVYKLVSKNWIYLMTFMIVIIMVGVIFLAFQVWRSEVILSEQQNFQEIIKERNRATDEMLILRSYNQKFSYNWACEYAKEKGKPCLENPRYWADPEKYPLIKDNPSGSGLFPIK